MGDSEKSRIQRLGITNEKLPTGKYELNISKEGYIPRILSVAVPSIGNIQVKVSLEPINKSTLKHENERLRATITASTALSEVKTCVAKSEALIDLSPPNWSHAALKEFKKTTKTAHDRVEELRSQGSGFSLGAKVSAAGELGGSMKRSSRRKPLVG